MKTTEINSNLVYYEEGTDPNEECVAMYNFEDRTLMNMWGTIRIKVRSDCTDMLGLVNKLKAFEDEIRGELG